MSQGARRSTLGPVDPNPVVGSALPLPQSAIKAKYAAASSSMLPRQSVARPSLAPRGYAPVPDAAARSVSGPRASIAAAGFQRQSQAQDADAGGPSVHSTPHGSQGARSGQGYGSVSRASVNGAMLARQSVAPTPTGRRSVGRQSMAAGVGPGGFGARALSELRPLRQKAFMDSLKERVFTYLSRSGFQAPNFSQKSMSNPTQAHVIAMFRHVYNTTVDAQYRWTQETKKEADEIISLMTDIKYPLVGELSKTKLSAAGSAQNWPAVVAMIDWMVCMANNFDDGTTYVGAGPLEREVDEDDESDQHLFFSFLWKCYDRFWDNQDTYPDQIAELDQIFAERNHGLTQEVETLEAEQMKLAAELREYTDTDSPLVVQTKEKETLEGDISKFIKYRDDILNPKLAKSKKGLERLRATIVESRDELRRLETERKELDGQVSAQEMSSEEFDRMSAERDTLQRQLQEIATTNEQAAREAWKLEMEVTKWQEGVEERFKNFNLLATTVDVLPLRLSNGEELDELEIVPRNPTTMLRSGVDMKHVVKPRINDVRNHAQQRFRELSDKKLEVEEDMTGVDEVLGALSEEVTQLEAHTTRQKKSLEETQNVSADEARLFAADIMEQERAVQDAEQAGYRAVQYAEAKLAALHRQFKLAQENDKLYRDKLAKEVELVAGELVSMKESTLRAVATLSDAAERACRD